MEQLLRDKLEILSSDKKMLQAIYNIFTDKIDETKPDIKHSDDNSLLGEKYRSYVQSKQILLEVLTTLETYEATGKETVSFDKSK